MKLEIGIDLGTTNSVVAFFENGAIQYLRFRNKESLTSTMLYQNGKTTIGEMAKRKSAIYPSNFIKSSKTFMGDNVKTWKIEDKEFTPTDVATEVLNEIAKELKKKFSDLTEVKAVITVPAYFTSTQIDETKKAGERAGFIIKQIVTEPVSAAVAYGFESQINQKLFIVDIGGGTFDTSILEVDNKTFNTLAIGGDNNLGGDDFDNHILEYLLKFIRKDKGINLASFEKSGLAEDDYRKAYQALINKAEEVKIELSEYDDVEIEIANLFSGYNLSTSITRAKFEEISSITIDKIKREIEKTLTEQGFSSSDIDKVVLVGGSARIPVVREFVTNLFGKNPYSDKPLDKLVAMGASIVAHDDNTVQIRDIISHSLGIELVNDKYSPILKKNSKYPLSNTQTYTTVMDYQANLDINVFEGEDEDDVNTNSFYGGFSLQNIEQAPAGIPQIEVTFEFDKNRILKVTAKDVRSGSNRSENIQIDKGEKKKITPDRMKAHIMFVLDTTGSMHTSIEAVKQAILKVVNVYSESTIDITFGITEFRDRVYNSHGGDSGLTILKVHNFGQSNFTIDTSAFTSVVSTMYADGGGPEPESSYDAINEAVNKANWINNNIRIVVHITDANPNCPDLTIRNIDNLYENLNCKFDQIFHLMPSRISNSNYSKLSECKSYSSPNKKVSQFFEELKNDTTNIVEALIKIAKVSSTSLKRR